MPALYGYTVAVEASGSGRSGYFTWWKSADGEKTAPAGKQSCPNPISTMFINWTLSQSVVTERKRTLLCSVTYKLKVNVLLREKIRDQKFKRNKKNRDSRTKRRTSAAIVSGWTRGKKRTEQHNRKKVECRMREIKRERGLLESRRSQKLLIC